MDRSQLSDRPAVRRALWAAVAVCLLGGLVAIPTTGDQPPDASTTAASRSGADSAGTNSNEGGEVEPAGPPGDELGPAGGGPGRPDAPGPAADASPTTFPPPADLGAAQEPGPSVPPRPGVYRYRVQARGDTAEATTTVEDKGSDNFGRNQVVSMKGGGFDSTSDVSWRSNSVVVSRSTFTFGETRSECDWDPDFVQARLPLANGVAWQSTSSCATTFAGTPVVIKRALTAKVVDLRRVRIAGQPVDAWVIEVADRFDFAGRVIEQQGLRLFSPKHGLVVSESGKVTFGGPEGNQSGDYSSELLNLE
jgi:hypothetical protein